MNAISRRVMPKAWLAIVLAIAGATAFVAAPGVSVAGPNSVVTTSVGIDTNPSATPANTATTLGTIETCRAVNNGDTFTVDFYVSTLAAPGIEGFQADLSYTSTKLKVTANNVSLLLGANAGSSVSDFTNYSSGIDALPDTDGKFTPAAVDFGTASGHSETGTGVLARVTLQAIANGAATLTLTNVKLSDPSFNAIGDTNFDGVFDGPVSNAQIRIGQSCPTASVGGVAEGPDVAALPRIEAQREQRDRLRFAVAAVAVLGVAMVGVWRAWRRAG